MQRTVLDPFSTQAKNTVKKAPPLDQLPEEVFDTARKKVSWLIEEKRPPKSIFSLDSEIDILSWYVLYFSVGTNFTQYSNETRMVEESIYSITKTRLEKFETAEEERVLWRLAERLEIIERTIENGESKLGDVLIRKKDRLADTSLLEGGRKTGFHDDEYYSMKNDLKYARNAENYGLHWKTLIPLISAKKTKLTDWYIPSELGKVGCNILLSVKDLIEIFSALVTVDTLKHMDKLRAEASHIKTPRTDDLARYVSSMAEERTALMPSFTIGKAGTLKPDMFPPCIKGVIKGVTSGSRNFAITVFLTAFLSYARIAPEKTEDPRISDYVKDQKVINEIMPLINAAADKCSPPFFEDQPLERLNVVYHLGLGMNEEPRLENSGASKWYFPPNCDKVRLEAPLLCKPDEVCKRITNPLNYYFITIKDVGDEEEEKEDKEE